MALRPENLYNKANDWGFFEPVFSDRKEAEMKSPARKWTSVLSAALIGFAPQFHALAAAGPAAPSAPILPFDDPTWQALVGLRRRMN
jgi:hypothetical protein